MASRRRSVMDDPPRRRRPRALGAFIFAGGFHVGVSQHFDLIAHLEGDGGYGTPTTRLNFPDLPIYHGPANWPLEELKAGPEIDFIYGNPPCAAWSGNNPNSHDPDAWRTDPRVNCTHQHFGLLETLRPKVWAWESVTQAPDKGRDLVEELTRKALALGYSVTQVFHDAQWLGTPQIRKRWFLVCHRVGLKLRVPNWAPPTTVVEALAGIKPVGPPAYDSGGLGKVFNPWLPKIPPGTRLRAFWEQHIVPPERQTINDRGNVSGRPGFGHIRLKADGPASATVGYAMVHPIEHRFLSINEVGVLAGFPNDYQFIGNTSGAVQLDLIARGVCPPVGAWLAGSIKDGLELNQPVTTPEATVVDYRLPPSSAEGAPKVKKVNVPAAAPAAKPAKASVPTPTKLLDAPPAVQPGEKSGAYIRRLLTLGYGTDVILACVHGQFPGSKATKSDIGWNKAKLAKEGADVPPTAPRTVQKAPALGAAYTGTMLPPMLPPMVPQAAAPKKQPKYASLPPGLSTENPQQHELPWTAPASQATQRKSLPAHIDPNREFDHTALTAKTHGDLVHRDYAAHFFRWGFAGRFIGSGKEVLDVGCGVDTPLLKTLRMPMSNVPARYVGVDYNPEPAKYPHWAWATFHWGVNFIKIHRNLGQFDFITNLEVIEHMSADDGFKLLKAMKACLKPDGSLLLSTPVFNGKAAANHIHEYTVEELTAAIHKAGLKVVNRFGTFANTLALKKVAKGLEMEVANRLRAYYSDEVLSCFLAPLYPDASRNNAWLLTHR